MACHWSVNGSDRWLVSVRKWEGGTREEDSVLWESSNLSFQQLALILALLKTFANFWRTFDQCLFKVIWFIFWNITFIFMNVAKVSHFGENMWSTWVKKIHLGENFLYFPDWFERFSRALQPPPESGVFFVKGNTTREPTNNDWTLLTICRLLFSCRVN